VSLTLYFLRYALGVNLVLCLLWIACAVVPFLLSPPATFAWSYFTVYPPLALLQGYGLHNTFLLYGDGRCTYPCMQGSGLAGLLLETMSMHAACTNVSSLCVQTSAAGAECGRCLLGH
jgi:hypothetical protein